MKFLSYFFPQTIEEVYSPVNGRIKVIEQLGSRYISIGGLSQSGGLVKNLWETGLDKIQNSKLNIKNCLVLGVGGGTVIRLLNQYYPNTQITGVEIDPLMITLGKKYLGLESVKNTHIIISDAIKWVEDSYTDKSIHQCKFDLILVDLYLGREIPKGLADDKFLGGLKKLSNKHGIVIFNLLRNREKKENKAFIIKLNKIFNEVTVYKPLVNCLIYCR